MTVQKLFVVCSSKLYCCHSLSAFNKSLTFLSTVLNNLGTMCWQKRDLLAFFSIVALVFPLPFGVFGGVKSKIMSVPDHCLLADIK